MDPGTITHLLEEVRGGRSGAVDDLFALVYEDCRRRAAILLRGERPGHDLQSGDLVNEGLVKLLRGGEIARAADRMQLFCAYARAARQLLIDHARRRDAERRGGGRRPEPLDALLDRVEQRGDASVVELHDALEAMARHYPEEARVVELHWFGDHTLDEIALLLEVSRSTVERRHRFGIAELRRLLQTGEGP